MLIHLEQMMYNTSAMLLLFCELLHVYEHGQVAMNIRKYSDHNLQDKRWYFMLDGFTALLSYIIIGMPFHLLPIWFFHCIAHIFYAWTWNDSYYAIRIRQWTSTDKSPNHHYTVDFYLTLFDIMTHMILSYNLFYAIGSTTL